MVDQADIAKIKSHGFKFFGLTGQEFLLPDGRVIGVDEALHIIREIERRNEDCDDE